MTDRLFHALVAVESEFKQYEKDLTQKEMAMVSVCLSHLWAIKNRVAP